MSKDVSCFCGHKQVAVLHFDSPRAQKCCLANDEKSNKSYRTFEFKVALAILSVCHVQDWALPGTTTVESTDTVPRIAGMKISLFIMGPNQISDAICLLANA
ncbi:hypothetical protein PO909_012616 [Leuciscus waleckii]